MITIFFIYTAKCQLDQQRLLLLLGRLAGQPVQQHHRASIFCTGYFLHNPESCGAAELIFGDAVNRHAQLRAVSLSTLTEKLLYLHHPIAFFLSFVPQHNYISFLLCRLLGMWSWEVSFKRRGGNLDKTGLDIDTAGVSLREFLIYKYINTIPLLLFAHESPRTRYICSVLSLVVHSIITTLAF